MLSRAIILKIASLRPVERLVRKSFLFRPLVKRFVAGESLEEAMKACQDLADRGFFLSLDYLGENVKSSEGAAEAKDMYITMLRRIAESPLASKPPKLVNVAVGASRPNPSPGSPNASGSPTSPARGEVESCNISIKLTQCGFDISDELTEKHYSEVVEEAAQLGNFVRVDMEGSTYTERTVRIVTRMFDEFPNTGTVLQAYLKRTPDDVELMIQKRIRTRLVKGAYLEPATVAYQSKKQVNEQYIKLGTRLLDAGNYPAIATHDPNMVSAITEYASANGIDKSRFEFQMIFGVGRPLQNKLISEGYNVRIYVPFGESWYPYFTRRIAERPANAMFILKSLIRG